MSKMSIPAAAFLITAFPALAVDSPASVAKRFVQAASSGDPKALDLLTSAEKRRLSANFAKQAKLLYGKPPGSLSAGYGDALGEFVNGDAALVVLRRVITADPSAAKAERPKLQAQLDEYFPKAQRSSASRLIAWKGDTFETVISVRLEQMGGAWKVTLQPLSDYPTPAFRSAMMKKWGCNLLRWGNDDDGGGGEFEGEVQGWSASKTDEPDCMFPETMEHCKKGQEGCFTPTGEPCQSY